MQYHFVVVWDEEHGWRVDWDTTDARFPEGSVFVPNLGEWVKITPNTETDFESEALDEQLDNVFEALNEKIR
jgi:hypothetical protein